MAKNFLGQLAMTNIPGVKVLTPDADPSVNVANFQAAADNPVISDIWLTSGVYDYDAEIFLYGKKSLYGYPGAVMRIVKDLSDSQETGLDGGPGFLHIGSIGRQASRGGTGAGIDTWRDSAIEGIEFQTTGIARTRYWVYSHGFERVRVENCLWNLMSQDSSIEAIDSAHWLLTNGNSTYYKEPADEWGTFKDIKLINNGVQIDGLSSIDNLSATVGLRVSDCNTVLFDRNTIVGTGDDPLDAVLCKNVRMVNNHVESVAGRLVFNTVTNGIIANNVAIRIPDRNGNWKWGAMIGARNYLSPASYKNQGQYGNGKEMRTLNVQIVNNNLVFPLADLGVSSSIGIQLGGSHNVSVSGNVLFNSSGQYIRYVDVDESGIQIASPGLPISVRSNEKLIIKNNISYTENGGRTRLRYDGVFADCVQQMSFSNGTPTGGTFTLTYTSRTNGTYTTAPISGTADSATIQAALRLLAETEGQGTHLKAVTVTGSGPFTITFVEVSYRSGNLPVSLLAPDDTLLVGANLAQSDIINLPSDGVVPDPVAAGEQVQIFGNIVGELVVQGDITEMQLGDNIVSGKNVTATGQTLSLGQDDIVVESGSQASVIKLPSPIRIGMSPIVGSVEGNGFTLQTVSETMNTILGSITVPPNSMFKATARSKTAYLIEVYDELGNVTNPVPT